MKMIAVLLAGGSGQRMGNAVAKQFLKIGNKPILQHSIEAFQNHHLIDEICIVIHPDYLEDVQQLVCNKHYPKLRFVLNGGKERSDSSLAAITAYEKEPDVHLIFHDAVRPFVSERIISDVITELKKGKPVAVAIPTSDTIFRITDNNCIESVPDRSLLRRAQTPQAFPYRLIRKAYGLALQDPDFIATDDCGVVLNYLPKEPIAIVDGEETNIKITFEQDLLQGEQIFNRKQNF